MTAEPSRGEQAARLALTVGLAIYGVVALATPDSYRWIDALDVAIHESGHLVFAWGGEFLTALGGTLFQLIVPAAFVAYFWRRDRHGATVALWWVAQNFGNIARYVADARAQELPLVGGGEHDWAYLLAELDLLHADQRIAGWLRFIGGALLAIATLLGVLAIAYRRPTESLGAGGQ